MKMAQTASIAVVFLGWGQEGNGIESFTDEIAFIALSGHSEANMKRGLCHGKPETDQESTLACEGCL